MNRKANDDGQLRTMRDGWTHRGQLRPDFAEVPGPNQESVWDYPRPPAIAPDSRLIEVRIGDLLIASSKRAIRILETASPPTFYLPREDVGQDLLKLAAAHSFCEWKGEARYYDLKIADTLVEGLAWSYERPFREFAKIAGYFSFYPNQAECYVDGERAQPQPGGFYGGWITNDIVGPYKGQSGSAGW